LIAETATRTKIPPTPEHGLILLSCGVFANTIRLLTPLTISDTFLEEGLDMLEQALMEIA